MTLTIGAMPHSQWQPLVSNLKTMDAKELALNEVENWYYTQQPRNQTDGKMLLLHVRAEYAIAQAMQEGVAPNNALSAWQLAAKHLLRHYRHNRRQSALIDIKSLIDAPEVGLLTLSEHLGINVELASPSLEEWQTPANDYLLIASQLVQQSEETADLMAELEASSLPLNEAHYAPPLLDITACYQQLNERIQQHQMLTELQDKFSQSQATNANLETSQQAAQHAIENLQQQLALSTIGLNSAQDQARSDAQRFEQQEQERTLLLDQLHQVQQELETMHIQKADVLSQLKQQREDSELSQQQTLRVEAELSASQSHANQLNEQLNAANLELQIAQNRNQHETRQRLKSEQECALVLEQLHQVQQELEAALALKHETDSQITNLKQQLSVANQDLANSNAQLIELKKKLDAALAQQHNANNQIDQLKQQLSIANQDLVNSNAQLTQYNKNQETALAQLEQSEQQRQLLKEQLEQTQQKLEALYNDRESLRLTNTELETALQAATGELSRLHDTLQQLQSSSLWKAVSPIQKLAKPFKRATPDQRSLSRQMAQIKTSKLFDTDWYLGTYPDVASSGIDPIRHYLKFGAAEERDPSPEFCSSYYLRLYPDVKEAGINPLIHYIKFGKDEGRLPKAPEL